MNIAMLISGGVDSSVALHKLVQQGHSVTAFYLKIWLEDELAFLGTCPWQEDLAYVRAVCEKLAVKLEVVSFQKQYWDRVVSYTLSEIKKGRTPNPDIMCNQQVKFGAFYELFADQFDAIATGHYAQTYTLGDVAYLHQSPDPVKDQTYFLARLCQQQLKKALFPIGNMTKSELREYAHRVDLPNKARKDSQGICFLGKLKFSEFVQFHLGEHPGDLIEFESGSILGKHKGAWFFTVGQRQGIGLAGGPWYVVSKDLKTHAVYISKKYYEPDKRRDTCEIEDLSWISGENRQQNFLVKLRHGPKMIPATINYLFANRAQIVLSEQDQGIAAGQFAVLYEGDRCVASGIIS
ncbi:MAG: tRNA 2-thiouridine(34) synthase MnmA [Candidatus Babeliaceae bacterium]|nr:tRNA 2-thiouridine(34) synthase MnmA [Candidatus Babeliaceae bacterium]